VQPISYKRHRFPPGVIRYAGWAYFRFTMSLRDVEDLLAERGIHVSYEAIRGWTMKFGPAIARNIRRARHKLTGRWHRDEMFVKIGGERMWLWRASHDEGEVPNMLVQKHRDTKAALKRMRKLLSKHGPRPETIVTDGLKFYGAAMKTLNLKAVHRPGRLRDNNRVEGSDLPTRRRERKKQRIHTTPGLLARIARKQCRYRLLQFRWDVHDWFGSRGSDSEDAGVLKCVARQSGLPL